MWKIIAIIIAIIACSFFIVLITLASIPNCKLGISCTAENNVTFSSGHTGSRFSYTYTQCDNVRNTIFSSCINGIPSSCPNRNCSVTCNTSPGGTQDGYTVTYEDCNDVLHTDGGYCGGCPTPTPTPDRCASCEYDAGFICIDNNCTISPVVIDIQGNGFNLTNAANGVNFDIGNQGVARRIAWTSADSDDAWLALDRNGNSTIDRGAELFGTSTEQPASKNKNGFLALAEFDKPANGGNADNSIDYRDAIFVSLRLWQDVNHNGISEPTELHTLSELGIAGLELDFKESRRTDEFGNKFRYRAKVWDVHGAHAGRWAWDVFLIVE
jgi:hypothetical protein